MPADAFVNQRANRPEPPGARSELKVYIHHFRSKLEREHQHLKVAARRALSAAAT